MTHASPRTRRRPPVVVVLVVAALVIGIGVGFAIAISTATDDRTTAAQTVVTQTYSPTAATSFIDTTIPGAESFFVGGRDLVPGFYRTVPPPGMICWVSVTNMPQSMIRLVRLTDGSLRVVGPDGYATQVGIPGHAPEFLVRDQYMIEVAGPCLWQRIG